MKISFTKPCSGLFLGFLILITSNLNAQIQTSPGAFGSWTDGSNWVGGTPPGSLDIAQINSDAGINITTAITVTELRVAGTLQVGSLGTVTITKASANALTFSSGTINLFGNMTLNGTAANLSHTGGTLTINTGRILSVTGDYNQTGGTLLVNSGGTLSSNTLTLRSSTISGTGTITNNITINGTSNVDAGSLTTSAGTITLGTGGTLTTLNSGTATSFGLLTVNSGGAISIGSGTTINCNGFTVASGASSITLNGNLDIGGGAWSNNGAVSPIGGNVYDFSSLTNASSIALSGTLNGPSADGTVINSHTSTITNTAGVITASGTSSIYVRGTSSGSPFADGFVCGNNTFTDAGTNTISTYGNSLVNFGGSATGTFNSITVSSGSLELTGPTSTSMNGVLTVATGATASILAGRTFNFIGGSLSNSGTLTNAATLIFNNLTLSPASTVLNNNGTIQIFSNFNNNKGSGGLVSGVGSTFDFISSSSMTLNGSGTTAFHNFTHSGSGSLTGSANFSVAGNYANTSTGADLFTNNTVSFSGTGTLNGGSNGTIFKNITNTSGTRTASGKVNLRGILSIPSGTFVTGGSSVFTLESYSAETGSVAAIGGVLSGDMTIQRYLASGASWKYLAFPFSSTVTVADLQTAGFAVTGHFASGTSFGQVGESFYVWTAGQQAWNGIGWGSPATNLTNLSNTTGYSAYAYAAGSSTITLTGTPAKGAIVIPISTGDNLIPNPYPSAIDFKNFTNRAVGAGTIGTGMAIQTNGGTGSTLAYWNGTIAVNSWDDVNWKGEVAMGQSFWVTATGTGNLTLQETDKYSAGSSYFVGRTEASPENYVRITLASGNLRDQSVVMFTPEGSESFNSKLDFVKRLNGNGNPNLDVPGVNNYLNLSTFKKDSDKPLVFSYLPLLECNSAAVSVGIKVGDVLPGEHSLKFTDLETFNAGYRITLVDKFMNKQVSVSNGFSYTFTTTDVAATSGAGRFELKFEPQPIAIPSVAIVGTKLTTTASKAIQWYKDGKVITGATGETYTATESGIYTVKSGYSEKCQAESLPVVLTITGLDKESLITAYPNPTGDILSITYPSKLKIEKVSLFDSKGGYVSDLNSISATESTLTFDVSDISAGLYILRLKSANDTNSIKILKK